MPSLLDPGSDLVSTGGITDGGALKKFDSVWSSDENLSHMADVEDRGALPAVQMFLDDSFACIVDRKVVP